MRWGEVAILLPDAPKDCPRSERIVFQKLGNDLPEDWVVLHSLGLPGHETKVWGEADIVVLSTMGLFALEVKGGKVACTNGIWHFGEPGKKGYTKHEDPWSQAKGTMFAIKKKLQDTMPEFGDLLFGFGVVMPMENFTATAAEVIPEVLLDNRDFAKNTSTFIEKISHHWQETLLRKHGRKYVMPSLAQIRKARDVLRPDIASAYSIGSYLTSVDGQLLQLTNAQIRASRRMAANPRTVVRGSAGTGKSVLAVERACQLSARGAKVLFLTYNHLLAKHFAAGLKTDTRAANVEVRHAHGLYSDVIKRAGLSARLEAKRNDQDYFGRIFPQVFFEAVLTVDLPCWDALVVDEAQDLLTPEHLDAFDAILRDGLLNGEWHIFLDPLQNIYSRADQEAVESRLGDAHPAYDDLWENCRNTRQIASQTSIMSGIDHAIDGAVDGHPCDNIYFGGPSDFQRKLESTVSNLLRRGVQPEEIVVLSTRKKQNSSVASFDELAGLPLVDISTGAMPPKNAIHFCTIHSFKGLERPVVLAIDINDLGDEQHAMLHYTGLSRAKALLRTFLPNSQQARYSQQAKAFGMRIGTNQLFG